MEEDDHRLRVRLVGRDGRRRFDPASKSRLVAACLEPGVSVSRLALEHGVNANLLRKWIKVSKESHPLPPSSPPAFIPVHIDRAADRVLSRSSVPIDNNLLERDIRIFATGRKSWLFSDTVDGAKASAVIYSLMLTCRACGIEPLAWLRHALTELPQRTERAEC